MSSRRDRSSYPEAGEPLPGRVADSHCHLDIAFGDGSAPDVAAALERAAKVGVEAIVQVGIDVASSRLSAEIAEQHDHVWATVALHPNEAPRIFAEHGGTVLEAAWREISELAEQPQVRAIGETGMDFYRTEAAGRAAQEESFRAHIRIAKATDKALVIHDREAHDDVLRIVDDEGAPDVVVLHCFSGDERLARAATERGYYCSFAGTLTFKNAQSLRDALPLVDAERVLVETDAPFLAPMPHRGRPNASYLLPETVRAVADVRGWDLQEACEQLWQNTERALGPL